MILATVQSANGISIRLTDERWGHILEAHPYMGSYYDDVLVAMEDPEYILRGHRGALIAVIGAGKKKVLHVVYRELSHADGFIATAYLKDSLDKKRLAWRRDYQ